MGPTIDRSTAQPAPRSSAIASQRSSCWSALKEIGGFGCAIVCLSAFLSLLIFSWTPYSWWVVFRRCVSVASATVTWLLIRKVQRRSFASYGLSFSEARRRELCRGVLLGIVGLMVMFLVGFLTGLCRISVTPDHTKLWRTILGFLPAVGLIGVLEELVFRGVLLQGLLPCHQGVAVVVSSLLYSLVHLKTRTMSLGTGYELIGLFLLGVVLSLSYLRTAHLTFAIGLHAVLAYGARVNKLFLEFPQLSLTWFTGTNRLVNGLMGWALLLLMAWLVAHWPAASDERS